jgi:hypothetical protein
MSRKKLPSGEQSFTHLLLNGMMNPTGRYVACTPCWRIEDPITEWSREYFMKVELFDGRPIASLDEMAENSHDLFSHLCPLVAPHLHKLHTLEGIDVMLGKRAGDFSWLYGTGLAEPRFSQACAEIIDNL